MTPRLLFVAGGTGGHLFPAMAVADRCREIAPEATIEFVGTHGKIEEKIVPRAGYPLNLLWISGITKRMSFGTLVLPLKVTASIVKASGIIARLKPHAVICAGAYVSYPVGVAASLKRVPLVLMESNAYPGLVTRKLAPRATEIHVAFDSTRSLLANSNVLVSGNPVRKVFSETFDRGEARRHFGLDPNRPTVFVFGGSLGANSINVALDNGAAELIADGAQIIWQTGTSYEGGERREPGLYRATFIHEMHLGYAAADLVVARAGATTAAELAAVGKASVLVPLPIATVRQRENAEAMENAGASVMVLDQDLETQLLETVRTLLASTGKLEHMGNAARQLAMLDADDRIARSILAHVK
ncbi:MAG: undecaprenyldiphospho-muramoylpentapeptide beta-N-acetylglucosaminyltransferase [bacterium]|nr:undecaprenyldiphospho-muramoylpentapeptide beta-N-acetylglucosaminyltransferase [Candidatus Kapabacteria bacterium]